MLKNHEKSPSATKGQIIKGPKRQIPKESIHGLTNHGSSTDTQNGVGISLIGEEDVAIGEVDDASVEDDVPGVI